MAWFLGERRGPQWNQGWRAQTMASLPPLPLIAFFAVVLLFLSISRYVDYKFKMQETVVNLRLILFILPVLLIFIVRYMFLNGRLALRLPRAEQESIHRAGSSPWGVAVLVVVLLLMISYQSSFHSQWFRPLWRSY